MNLEEQLGREWFNILKDEFTKPYMQELSTFITQRRKEVTVYPPASEVFNAYRLTPYDKVKIVIIGQDPYINPFEAHGISFSTFNNQPTPSLRRIEKVIREQVYKGDPNYTWSNDLTRWTKQGILLLNRVLTVDAGKSNSHKGKGWESFTFKTVQSLDKGGVIFLLWGNEAKTLSRFIQNSIVLECEHPIAGAYKGQPWDNKDCFNKVNELLIDKIEW